MTIARDGDLPDRPSENTSTDELLMASREFDTSVEKLMDQLKTVSASNATAMSAVEALGDLTRVAGELLAIVEPFVAGIIDKQSRTSDGSGRSVPPLANLQASLTEAIQGAAALHGTFLREIKAFK